MRELPWNKLGVVAAVVGLGVAACFSSVGRSGDTPARRRFHTDAGASAVAMAPGAIPEAGSVLPAGAPTLPMCLETKNVAEAGSLVVARSAAQALGQAAAEGNDVAVRGIAKGLRSYGNAARVAIQEELTRVKNAKSREALERVLQGL